MLAHESEKGFKSLFVLVLGLLRESRKDPKSVSLSYCLVDIELRVEAKVIVML